MIEIKMRFGLISLAASVATSSVILNAFYQKKQLYPTIVYLSKSNPSMAVLYAQVFVIIFLLAKAMKRMFFGQLRAAELEHLVEKFWYVITETCLAFTVFRDDFNPRFVALFTFLLFMKAFHWLIEDRVDYMERSPVITLIFHARVISLVLLLGTVDAVLIQHAFQITLTSGASVQMVFGFEYAILLTMVVAIILKYVLHSIDCQSDHPWENKNVYLLYAELTTGFVKCCLYAAFVYVMVKIHTFPLFAIRPMYLTIRSFKKSLTDVILSRRAITQMNTRFPNATEAELRELDNTCIICREPMLTGKKLPCNHIFHVYCLRSWFQRQQSCPTCRMDVLSATHPIPSREVPPQPPASTTPQAPSTSSVHVPSSHYTFHTTMTSSANTMPLNAPPAPMFAAPNVSINPFIMPGMFPSPFPPFLGSTLLNRGIDLSSLSDEQLRNMEGQERVNVESRVKMLKNIHFLLDNAMVHLNQYSQVIQNLNAISTGENGYLETSSSKCTGFVENIGDSEENVVADELRRRRLEKFNSTEKAKNTKSE